MAHPPAPHLIVSPAERAVLECFVRARTTEQRLAPRARLILDPAAGVGNKRIARQRGPNLMTVLLWRRRFETGRLAGLMDAPRPGRPPIYSREDRDRVIALTLEQPDGTTHWSARRIAARVGMSITTVQRVWAEAGLQPHRIETFEFSTDPQLEAKVRDVVGLYLAPPGHDRPVHR